MMKYWVVILTIGTNVVPIMSAIEVNADLETELSQEPVTTTTVIPTTLRPTIDDCAFYNPVPGLQNRYLRLHTMEKNWEQARITCEVENGFLAVPRSGREIELYMDHINRLGLDTSKSRYLWIGVRRKEQYGPITTVQGDSLTYEQLNQSSPIPFDSWYVDGCWKLYSSGIHVGYCGDRYPFLCEKHNCG